MENILRIVLLMGLQASVLIVVVLVLRLVLKKVPKVYTHILWLVVVARLLVPVFFESPVGIAPSPEVKGTVVAANGNEAEDSDDMVINTNPVAGDTEPVKPGADIQTGIERPDNSEEVIQTAPVPKAGYTSKQIWTVVIFGLWVSGIAVMLSYVTIKYLIMRRKLRFATRLEGNVWECENVESPFVMGFFAPKIYLPYGIPEDEKKYILSHERMHIRHFDTHIRMLVTLALCIHWWNPLVWLATHVIKVDMEMLCDESVLRYVGIEDKKRYSDILLTYAVKSSGIVPVLSFGESNTESRVKHIFRVRKPALIVSCVLIVTAVVSIVCIFSTKSGKNDGDKQPEVTTEELTEPVTDEPTEIPTEPLTKGVMEDDGKHLTPMEMMKSVLLGKHSFIDIAHNEESNLLFFESNKSANDNEYIQFAWNGFGVVDFDGDGISEVIVRTEQLSKDTLLFHYEDGKVYMSEHNFNGMNMVYENGIIGSGTGVYGYFHRMEFVDGKEMFVELASHGLYYEYSIGGAPVSKEKYYEYTDELFEGVERITEYDFTAENIEEYIQ